MHRSSSDSHLLHFVNFCFIVVAISHFSVVLKSPASNSLSFHYRHSNFTLFGAFEFTSFTFFVFLLYRRRNFTLSVVLKSPDSIFLSFHNRHSNFTLFGVSEFTSFTFFVFLIYRRSNFTLLLSRIISICYRSNFTLTHHRWEINP